MPNVLRRFQLSVPYYPELKKTHFRDLKLANIRTSNKADMISALRIYQLPTAAKMLTYFGMYVKKLLCDFRRVNKSTSIVSS
jgi:hypothetical protein